MGARALIATDLDGTLVGDPGALARLNLALAPARDRIALLYVTGRMLPSTLGLMAEHGLLVPDAIIAGVGTAIHHAPAWTPDPAWARRMAQDWDAATVDVIAAGLPALVPQPADALGPFKRSFWASPEAARSAIPVLARELRRFGVHARMIYSSGRDLDVVPARGGKGAATRHAAAWLGVARDRVVACGDSGNDVDLLRACGLAAVVANAGPDLRRRAPPHAYLAAAPYAGGVHEALRRFGVL